MQNRLWIVAACLFVHIPVRATTVVALDTRGLAEHSTIIGIAKVLRAEPTHTDAGWVTLAELQFYQGVKGVKAGEIVLVQSPGALLPDGSEVRVDGAPRFRPGQLLFGCFHEHGGVLKPTAMSLGVMPVIRDHDGVLRVTQRNEGLAFLRLPGSSEPLRVENRRLSRLLNDFRVAVESLGAVDGWAP